jgi:hypothetical protein
MPPRHGQRAVQFGAGGCSGKYADLKLLSAEVCLCNATCQLDGDRFGIAGTGKAAHSDLVAGADQCRGFFRAHNLLSEGGIQNSRAGLRNGRHEN